jgi:hypothetical protein
MYTKGRFNPPDKRKAIAKSDEKPLVPENTISAGKPGSPEWSQAVKRIREEKGKSINILTENKEDALRLLEESEKNLEMKPTYTEDPYKSGAEIHPEVNERELSAGNGLPHIKWKDWSKGKAGGAEGHIYYKN